VLEFLMPASTVSALRTETGGRHCRKRRQGRWLPGDAEGSIRWQTSTLPTPRRSRACHLETLRRILAEAASAVIYLVVGLVVLIAVLVIENARRGDPKARRTGGQASGGDGGGDGGG
jgi:hypothetical protein